MCTNFTLVGDFFFFFLEINTCPQHWKDLIFFFSRVTDSKHLEACGFGPWFHYTHSWPNSLCGGGWQVEKIKGLELTYKAPCRHI